MSDLFLSTAYAQTPGGAGGQGWMSFIPIVLMIAIFYFLLIRPTQKREKERKKMIDSLQKGDKVLTSGGIYGVVVNIKAEENIIVLKIAEGAKVEFARSAVQAKV